MNLTIKYDGGLGRWNVLTAPQRGKLIGWIAPRNWMWHFYTNPRQDEPLEPMEDRRAMENLVKALYA